MIIKPKIRGFVCITAHPTGCEARVQSEISREGLAQDGWPEEGLGDWCLHWLRAFPRASLQRLDMMPRRSVSF